jgi:hypothetical protein
MLAVLKNLCRTFAEPLQNLLTHREEDGNLFNSALREPMKQYRREEKRVRENNAQTSAFFNTKYCFSHQFSDRNPRSFQKNLSKRMLTRKSSSNL